jgi:hypothetical protein
MVPVEDVPLPPSEDIVLSMADLGKRWSNIHPKVACKRAKALGMPLIYFNSRSIGVRLSTVLKAEREATVK